MRASRFSETWLHRLSGAALGVALLVQPEMSSAVNRETTDAGEAARACASAAQTTRRINLSSGVYTERAVVAAPLYIDIPAGQDASLFDDCMQRSGFSPRERVTAEFERVAACNDPGMPRVVLKRSDTNELSIGGEFDADAYARCVASGPDVEVEIGP